MLTWRPLTRHSNALRVQTTCCCLLSPARRPASTQEGKMMISLKPVKSAPVLLLLLLLLLAGSSLGQPGAPPAPPLEAGKEAGEPSESGELGASANAIAFTSNQADEQQAPLLAAYPADAQPAYQGFEQQRQQQQQQQQASLNGLGNTNNLARLHKNLNERQRRLVERNPGSLMAVARAFKMAIVECRHQMRDELWDCPVFGFSIKPSEVFGKLVSRSFRETSFIQSLLSSALAHSIARACTESTISTCSRKQSRDGFSEDVDFGIAFAQEFMDAAREHSAQPTSPLENMQLSNNIIATGSNSNHHQQQPSSTAADWSASEPAQRERRIRRLINAHNEEVGMFHVRNGRRRECKCHGYSGVCSLQTCWDRLRPFREVASKLHDSLDQAIRLINLAHNPPYKSQKSSTSSVKKSNKKRSSVPQPQSGARSSPLAASSSPSSFISRPSSTNSRSSSNYYYTSSGNSLTSDSARIIGSRSKSSKRHTNSDSCPECHRTLPADNNSTAISNDIIPANPLPVPDLSTKGQGLLMGHHEHSSTRLNPLPVGFPSSSNTTRQHHFSTKRIPVARSIGTVAVQAIKLAPNDLLYYEDSPDFCVPNESYSIKGTKDRICSEDINASHNCGRLCCGRGYKTELREEQYKCECQFKYCCDLICRTCTRRKAIHICL